MPSSCSGSYLGGGLGGRPSAGRARLSRATMRRPMRSASSSSTAKWSARPLTRGVHLGAAEALVVALLARRHLDQRRSAEEHLRALVDHHDVVAHPGHVRPAGGRVPEHEGDRRHSHGRQLGEVVEPLTAGDEDLALVRKIGAARLHQVDHGQPVLTGDLHRPEVLAQRGDGARAAAHCGVVGDQHALGSLDDADAREHPRSDREVGAPGGQRRELEQWRVGIDQQLDALAGQQLATLAVAGDVLLAAPAVDERQLAVVLGEQGREVGAVGLVRLAALVDVVGQDRHARSVKVRPVGSKITR